MNTRPLSKKYLCKRLLLANYNVTSAEPFEADLLEVSPSEEYAKIKFKRVDGTSYTKWYHVNDYVVLEELEEEPRVNMEWIRELQEKERKDQEVFKKYSSPTVKTPSYWDSLPNTVCGSDHYNISAQDPKSFTQHSEVVKQKWVHGICNPPAKEYVKDCKSTGERYNSVDEMIKGMIKKEQINKLGLQSTEKIKASDLPGWGKHDKI
jgi:hypothetical protein